MGTVSFDEEEQLIKSTSSAPVGMFRGMSGWLVKRGLAANQTSADLTLVVVVIIAVGVSVILAISSSAPPNPTGGAIGDPGYIEPR
ncbi:MAG: hypothetical protein GEV13_00990 [Rhodospirillales bacterium]|nr:hypothetical protein [Rhodospirillales bacterium]